MRNIPDPDEPGRVGDLTLWLRILAVGDGFSPVVWCLGEPVWAKTVLKVYRPGFDPDEVESGGALGLAGQWPV